MAERKRSRFSEHVGDDARKDKSSGSMKYLRIPKGVSLYKEKAGSKSELDILPYIVESDNHPDYDSKTGRAEKGQYWYKFPFTVHRNVGVNNESAVCPRCIGLRCPICEDREYRLNEGESWDEVKSLKPSERVLYYVIPFGDKDYKESVHLWNISFHNFQDKLKEEVNEDTNNQRFPDPQDGLTLKVRWSEEQMGKTKYAQASRIDFEKRDYTYEDDFIEKLEDLGSLLEIKSYDELKKLYYVFGEEPEEVNKDDKEEGAIPIRRKKVSDSVETEEIEEEPPVRRSRRDEEPEESEEPEEEPVRKPRRTVDYEEPEEEEQIRRGKDEQSPRRKKDIEEEQPIRRTRKPPVDEEPEEEEKPRRKKDVEEEEKPVRRSRKTNGEPSKRGKKYECPAGGVFGKDFDKLTACAQCNIWDFCMDAANELK